MPLQEYIYFDKLYFSSVFTVADVTLQESENKKMINVRKEQRHNTTLIVIQRMHCMMAGKAVKTTVVTGLIVGQGECH